MQTIGKHKEKCGYMHCPNHRLTFAFASLTISSETTGLSVFFVPD